MLKRKVLIISYIWPPMEGIGSIRAQKFAKYLPEFGWEAVVLTVKERPYAGPETEFSSEANIKVFRTGYVDRIARIRGILGGRRDAVSPKAGSAESVGPLFSGVALRSFAREMIAMPDEQIGWRNFAVAAGDKIVEEEKIDLIFSTSPPETTHLIARSLKSRHGVPWVADLRDLWVDDHFRKRGLVKKAVLGFMEKAVLGEADAVLTVSRLWADRLASSLNIAKEKIRVIENAFDEDDFASIEYKKNAKFTITYTGKLHKIYQPVEIFFKCLKDLIKEGLVDPAGIEVKFYVMGYDKPDISSLAASYGLKDVVRDLGRVPYERSLELQRASDALLFIRWQGFGSDGLYSAKLYDYIGARRPILAICYKKGIIADLVRKISAGVVADSEGTLKEGILKLYREYTQNGSVRYGGDEDEISRHTRRVRTQKLAELFNFIKDGKKK